MTHQFKSLDDPVHDFILDSTKEKIRKTHDMSEGTVVSLAFCPFCGSALSTIFPIIKLPNGHFMDGVTGIVPSCYECHEMDPREKFNRSVDKADIFCRIHDSIPAITRIDNSGRAQMALLDQSVLLIISGLESYTKDVYVTSVILENGNVSTIEAIRRNLGNNF
jgi:hypothetical protein